MLCCAPENNPRRGFVAYICNLDVGHDGEHKAIVDGSLMASWSSDPAPSRLTHVSDLGDEYTESEARVSRIFDRLNQRIGAIIMGAADDAVKDVTDQLTKASSEIQAEVQKLQDAGVSDENLAGLKNVAQSLDDRTPDAPADEAPGDAGTNDGGNPDGETDTSE